MFSFFSSLFLWLPPTLQLLAGGVVMIFFIVFILNVIRFLVDLIPFL